MMYLWSILKKPKTELVREVYTAQKQFKTKASWSEQIQEDLQTCDIDLSDDEIASLSQYQMTKLVKGKLREQADKYLLNMKAKHVKTAKLFPTPHMREYLTSDELNTEEKKLLFKLRISMTQLKGNFSNAHKDNLQCELCREENSIETQMHLLVCNVLVNHPDLQIPIKTMKYDDIYQDLSSQVKAIKVWKKIFSIRKIELGQK